MTEAQMLKKMYQMIYAKNYFISDIDGKDYLYGGMDKRDPFFLDFITENIPPPAKILDASCGRGHLLRELIARGYQAEGTEIAPALLDTDLKGLPVKLKDYESLRNFGKGYFDVVISNDVLEHLVDEEAMKRALMSLCWISKKWILVSVGLGSALNFPKKYRKRLPVNNLHATSKPFKWWKGFLEEYIEPSVVRKRKKNIWFFGEEK